MVDWLVVSLLLLGTASGSVCAFPVVANPPRWSWDTLGSMAFVHSGMPYSYNASQLALLSKFSMVQFDKKENTKSMPNASQEDRFIAAARLVKAATNNEAFVLMYLNGLINFPAFERLHNATVANPSLLLRTSSGKLATIRKNTVFDVRHAAMRAAFVSAALYGMASGAVNGVFIDRANWAEQCNPSWGAGVCASLVVGQRALLAELTHALGEGNITLAKDTSGAPAMDWQVANAVMTSDTFCSQYCHGCSDTVDPAGLWEEADAVQCASSIGTIANMSARGQLTQSHAMGPYAGEFSALEREFTMAAFLIGAGSLSFYSYANWASSSWELPGTAWWPEYDYPLGEATSPANALIRGKRWKYSRNFSSGTTVYVDVRTHIASIDWAKKA